MTNSLVTPYSSGSAVCTGAGAVTLTRRPSIVKTIITILCALCGLTPLSCLAGGDLPAPPSTIVQRGVAVGGQGIGGSVGWPVAECRALLPDPLPTNECTNRYSQGFARGGGYLHSRIKTFDSDPDLTIVSGAWGTYDQYVYPGYPCYEGSCYFPVANHSISRTSPGSYVFTLSDYASELPGDCETGMVGPTILTPTQGQLAQSGTVNVVGPAWRLYPPPPSAGGSNWVGMLLAPCTTQLRDYDPSKPTDAERYPITLTISGSLAPERYGTRYYYFQSLAALTKWDGYVTGPTGTFLCTQYSFGLSVYVKNTTASGWPDVSLMSFDSGAVGSYTSPLGGDEFPDLASLKAALDKEKPSQSIPVAATTGSSNPSAGAYGPKQDNAHEVKNTMCDVDPVYLHSGEFYEECEDLRVKGSGLDFVWARKYRSRIGPAAGPATAINQSPMGNGWECSYFVQIERNLSNNTIKVRDGNTRIDVYRPVDPNPSSNTKWRSAGKFCELVKTGSIYEMIFEDKGKWQFYPFTSDVPETLRGRLHKIVDRNGDALANINALTLDYDAATGCLTTITDTMGRTITIGYTNGYVSSVDAGGGHRVDYIHKVNGDGLANGNAGDLMEVKYNGLRTAAYTYDTTANPQLKSNLLTITDGKNQTYLTNVYGTDATNKPGEFDRVISQTWGDSGDVINLFYDTIPIDLSAANNEDDVYAVIKTTVRNRNGHVSSYEWDQSNRLIHERRYTGVAAVGQSVPAANTRVRATDPPYYDTFYEWNSDSLRTKIRRPNGDSIRYTYDSSNADYRARANVTKLEHVPGPLGSDTGTKTELFEYASGTGGGCCGFNFVKTYTDPRNNVTRYRYDDYGNRKIAAYDNSDPDSPVNVNKDEWTYELSGKHRLMSHTWPSNGESGTGTRRVDKYFYKDGTKDFLESVVADANGLKLVTMYDTDDWGQVTAKMDSKAPYQFDPLTGRPLPSLLANPQGHDTRYQYDEHDRVVLVSSRKLRETGKTRQEKEYQYDGNGNVEHERVSNFDENGNVPSGEPADYWTDYIYDTLNKVRFVTHRMSSNSADNIVSEYRYDKNRNLTKYLFGEAGTGGSQANNAISYQSDERGLLFREILAEGDSNQSTTEYDYDGNENCVTARQGKPSDWNTTTWTYDGLDQVKTVVDPMGNVLQRGYDATGNLVSTRTNGQLTDVDGGTGNVRLSEASYQYTPRNWVERIEKKHFNPQNQTNIADGSAVTVIGYNNCGRVTSTYDDSMHETSFEYDSANRLWKRTDSKGNVLQKDYDADSNVMTETSTEKSDLSVPDDVFVRTFEHDELDRLERVTDGSGNMTDYAYDSRNNLKVVTDARRTGGTPGNKTRYTYDGLNRLKATTREMWSNYDGTGTQLPSIVTQKAWDRSSRLISQTDPNGKVTAYTRDPLNRVRVTTYSDGTSLQTGYNVHGDAETVVDPNNTQITQTYDRLGRLTHRAIAPGTGVSNITTSEDFRYDGASNLIWAQNNGSLVERTFDSLGNMWSDKQGAYTTARTFDNLGNMLSCSYPNGRAITYDYDELNRVKRVKEGSRYWTTRYYTGPDRLVFCHDNATILDSFFQSEWKYDGISGVNYPGDHGFRQITSTKHFMMDPGAILDVREYTWDENQNLASRHNLTEGGGDRKDAYTYDSAGRMARSEKSLGGAPADMNYTLDPAGNRTLVAGTSNNALTGAYTMSSTTPEPADQQMNQYTSGPGASRTYTYDSNGNRSSVTVGGGTKPMIYDYRGLLVDYGSGSVVYTYDALGRLYSRRGPGESQPTLYVYNADQVVEERHQSIDKVYSFVYTGAYVDEPLSMDDGDGDPLTDAYYQIDACHNVTAVTSRFPGLVERCGYDDFGRPNLASSKNPFLFAGRRYDYTTGLYDYRTRQYDPITGRFTSRDKIGLWGDPLNVGNGNTYVGNSPWNYVDPYGLWVGEYARDAQNWVLENAPSNYLGSFVYTATGMLTSPFTLGEGAAEISVNHDQMSGLNIGLTAFGEAGNALAVIGGAGSVLSKGLSGLGSGAAAAEAGLTGDILRAGGAESEVVSTIAGDCPHAPIKGVCFSAGTEIATPYGHAPIEAIHVGNRVLTTEADTSCTAVNPASWRMIRLRMPNPEAPTDILDIELLRSAEWISSVGCTQDATIWFDLSEMGLHGVAWVVSMQACPQIDEGAGRVVLATVSHYSTQLMEIRFEQATEPLEPTDRHRLFSVTKNAWVPAGELKPGEVLQTRSGTVTVAAVRAKPGIHRVHNLEVETKHCYFAGRLQVLSHNVNPCAAPDSAGEFANLASPQRTTHILTGDATGGGHLFPGGAGKSPFPQSWSPDRVMHEISDVATDPLSTFSPGRGGRTIATGTRDGVDITVVLESPQRGGGIVTGFPSNVPRNP